jgi:hypothetical protein
MRVRSSVSNLPFGVSVVAGVTSKAHQAHVSSLSCQAFACIRPVMRDNRGRHGLPSRFPVAFRLPAFASWAFLSRQGIVPFSRSAYPAPQRVRAGTSTGFPCSARTRYGWVRVPPFTPGQRCSHSRRKRISCRCRSSATSPALRSFSCLPELRVTKPHQGFTLVHPSTLPLACGLRTGQRPLGFSPRLRTPQYP